MIPNNQERYNKYAEFSCEPRISLRILMLYETVQSGYKATLVYVEKWHCRSRRVIQNLSYPPPKVTWSQSQLTNQRLLSQERYLWKPMLHHIFSKPLLLLMGNMFSLMIY